MILKKKLNSITHTMLVSTNMKRVILAYCSSKILEWYIFINDIDSTLFFFDMVHFIHCHVRPTNILDFIGPPLHVKWVIQRIPFPTNVRMRCIIQAMIIKG